jgi:hypothetical protein
VSELPEGLRYVSTYFTNLEKNSKSARHMRHPPMASDPPTSGWARCFIISGQKQSTLFYPFTLWSQQLPNRAAEIAAAVDVADFDQPLVVEILKRQWELRVRLRCQVDLDVGALVLNRLGESVPIVVRPSASEDAEDSQKVRGGKPIVPEAQRAVDPRSRRGGVLAFFLEYPPAGGQAPPDAPPATEPNADADSPSAGQQGALPAHLPVGTTRSIREAMAELDLTRSGVLSHLFALNRDHGIGYHLQADCATVLLPEGWDPFAAAPEASAKVAGETADGDAAAVPIPPAAGRAPRARQGKPNADKMEPIPEGTKRALVAEFFARGFATTAECEAATGVGARSAHSHLHDIHSYHGIGHQCDGERFRLTVPEGFRLTCPKKPREKKS